VLELMLESMMASTLASSLGTLTGVDAAPAPMVAVFSSSAILTTLEPVGYEYVSADLSTTTAAAFLPPVSMAPVACTTRRTPSRWRPSASSLVSRTSAAWTELTMPTSFGSPRGPVRRSTAPEPRPAALATLIPVAPAAAGSASSVGVPLNARPKYQPGSRVVVVVDVVVVDVVVVEVVVVVVDVVVVDVVVLVVVVLVVVVVVVIVVVEVVVVVVVVVVEVLVVVVVVEVVVLVVVVVGHGSKLHFFVSVKPPSQLLPPFCGVA